MRQARFSERKTSVENFHKWKVVKYLTFLPKFQSVCLSYVWELNFKLFKSDIIYDSDCRMFLLFLYEILHPLSAKPVTLHVQISYKILISLSSAWDWFVNLLSWCLHSYYAYLCSNGDPQHHLPSWQIVRQFFSSFYLVLMAKFLHSFNNQFFFDWNTFLSH